MKKDLNRRRFIQRAALAATAFSAANILPARAQTPPSVATAGGKLNCVQIGCGGRAMTGHLDEVIGRNHQNLYAVVDPDEKKHLAVRSWLVKQKQPCSRSDPLFHRLPQDVR